MLDWIGDLGGLFDGLKLFTLGLIAFFNYKLYDSYMVSQLFMTQRSEEEMQSLRRASDSTEKSNKLMKAIRGYFTKKLESNLNNREVSSLKMLLFDCLPRKHRNMFNDSSFKCLKRTTEYRLFEEGMRKYEEEINIVRLIRD